MIYDITPNFYGQVSAPKVFNPLWPQKFSVMGRIRPRKTKYPREGQYLFSLSDSSGRLYLGLKAYPSPTLEVLHSTGRMSSVSIPLPHDNINDGQWHQFGFGVSGPNVTMFYNCLQRTAQTLQSEPFIPNVYKSTLLIGSRMFAMDRGADERYEVHTLPQPCYANLKFFNQVIKQILLLFSNLWCWPQCVTISFSLAVMEIFVYCRVLWASCYLLQILKMRRSNVSHKPGVRRFNTPLMRPPDKVLQWMEQRPRTTWVRKIIISNETTALLFCHCICTMLLFLRWTLWNVWDVESLVWQG